MTNHCNVPNKFIFSFFPKLWRQPNKNPQLLQQSKPTKLDILLLSFENLQKNENDLPRITGGRCQRDLRFLFFSCSLCSPFFSAPLPQKKKNAAARVPPSLPKKTLFSSPPPFFFLAAAPFLFFQIFPPLNLPLLPVLSITSNLTHSPKKIIFFSSLSRQPGGLHLYFLFLINNHLFFLNIFRLLYINFLPHLSFLDL